MEEHISFAIPQIRVGQSRRDVRRIPHWSIASFARLNQRDFQIPENHRRKHSVARHSRPRQRISSGV